MYVVDTDTVEVEGVTAQRTSIRCILSRKESRGKELTYLEDSDYCRVVLGTSTAMTTTSHICKLCRMTFFTYRDLHGHYASRHQSEYKKIKNWLGPVSNTSAEWDEWDAIVRESNEKRTK